MNRWSAVVLAALAACGGSAFSAAEPPAPDSSADVEVLDDATPAVDAPARASDDAAPGTVDASAGDSLSGVDHERPVTVDASADVVDEHMEASADAPVDVAQEHEGLEACPPPVFLCGAGGCPLPYVSCTSSSAPHCVNTVCCQYGCN